MPLIEVTLVEGRTPAQVRALINALTEAAETSINAPKTTIRVCVREVPATHWAVGGETIAEQKSRSSPERTIGGGN
jgi:4-oxalocrotonate tautomerase